MENVREHIYLAALLHDIGKFYQRADKRFLDKLSELSEYSRKLAEDICPINEQGCFGYQHVVWTNEFLVKMQTKLEKVPGIKQNLYQENHEDSLPNFACNHHKPQTELQAIITLADWWSAGIDRRDAKEMEDGTENDTINWDKVRYKQIPLYSVFNGINAGKHQYAYPLQTLNIDEGRCFPKSIKEKTDGTSEEQYNKLWKQFSEEFEKLPTDSFNGFTESLLFLLKKYTWCIPSNTMDMANVSLYEHLKTTAAFADCLYLYKASNQQDFKWNESDKRLSINPDVCPVILLGGDISGIQKFIYNIASMKAAVSLKGRSFYLQLLIDSVIQRIISHPDIDVNIGNVVYSSGGKFYMLLPNTKKVQTAIRSLKREFEEELWKEHYGQLLLNLDYVPFAYSTKSKELRLEGKSGQTIGDLWKSLADKLALSKNQKFNSILKTRYDELFDKPKEIGGNIKVCAVTGIESSDCVKLDERDEDSPYVLPIVKKQAELGNVLKDIDYILTYKQHNEENTYLNNNHSKFNMTIAGISNYLFDQEELIHDNAEFRKITSVDVIRVKRVNNTDSLATQITGQKVSYGFQFYGGNKQAEKNQFENKSFEDLANGSYLGVLRMDVDNLGNIFIKGLPDEDKSFAAYATLSFLLDYFFSGYLNTIRNNKEFKDDVNILYSGGDDIFAVGRWDKLILFAEQIRKDFNKFVGRDDVSISGGIAIVRDKYPIAKAAELAGNAEDVAKTFNLAEDGGEKNKKAEKNAFNLFGENVSWKSEFDFVKHWKSEFVLKCDKENMPHSILHKLMILFDMKKRGEIKYAWHTVYYLKRFSERGNEQVIKPFCNNLITTLFSAPRNFHLIAVAARWAELELRDKNKSNNINL
jgi:CRISPR-associated protein Csm1